MQITGYIKWLGVTEEKTREDFVQKSDFAHSNPDAFKQACGGEPYFRGKLNSTARIRAYN